MLRRTSMYLLHERICVCDIALSKRGFMSTHFGFYSQKLEQVALLWHVAQGHTKED